jgi:hypothetical protein
MRVRLTEADLETLRRMADWFRQQTHSFAARRPDTSHEDPTAPEVYLAMAPESGIPAYGGVSEGPGPEETGSGSGDVPAVLPQAACSIWRVDPSTKTPKWQGFTRPVYNPNTSAIPGDTMIVVTRDKWGAWFVAAGVAASVVFFLWAKLLAFDPDTRSYSWIQQDPVAGGGWTDTPGGMTGTTEVNTAYNSNGACVHPSSVVQLWPGYAPGGVIQDWVFEQLCPPCGTHGTTGTGTGTGSI